MVVGGKDNAVRALRESRLSDPMVHRTSQNSSPVDRRRARGCGSLRRISRRNRIGLDQKTACAPTVPLQKGADLAGETTSSDADSDPAPAKRHPAVEKAMCEWGQELIPVQG